jgi:hypothetical protein
MTKEDKQDYIKMAKHFVVGASVAFGIAALGGAIESVNWLVIPAATGVVFGLSWASSNYDRKKDKIANAVGWSALTFLFTLAAVLS